MRQNSIRLLSALFLTGVFFSCEKLDSYLPKPPKGDSTCNLTEAYTLQSDKGSTSRLVQYQKEYNKTTGQVSKLVFGWNNGGSRVSYPLLLKYSGTTVSFVREAAPTDTFFVAHFDAPDGKLSLFDVVGGNVWLDGSFNPTEFIYSNTSDARLTAIYTEARNSTYTLPFTYTLDYDANGNVIKMTADPLFKNDPIVQASKNFGYDLSVAAKGQFYSDDFHIYELSESTIYLAQFLGWTPDLMPKNKRVSVKILERNPFAETDLIPTYEATLTNHVYDANGNLLSYKATANEAVTTYNSVWDCSKK